ncbi:uncharacterized protein LOC126610479 isoform X7 [Malus sylvestris]|uniref:uncharacterized protein LOC126610479 isoform X7 n=1 Tax=Malus sylvestris TaxID=3752 RepID=UPI0021ACCAC2|nr:uncharacterized protein LOC126610479 isoform X7 [Malus sylvestris]
MAEEIKPIEKPEINPEINPIEMSMAAEIKPIENPVDYRPWFRYVRRGDWCKAKEFLTLHPSAITATDSDGDTALHNAIYKEHEQIVEELVQLMTEEQLETKNGDGQTALTIAAAKNLKIVKCLVAKNKKLLGIANGSGSTPIVIAAKHDRWDIVEELVQLMTEEQLETEDDDGETALTIAVAKNLKIVKCLVAKNKKLLGIADGRGSTPIDIAAEHDQCDIVEELVQLMTEEQLETKNDDGATALTIAAAKDLKIVKCLVAKNKKLLGIAHGRGRTPIVIAAEHDRWDIVEELVQLMTEEQLETTNNSGQTALTIAAAKNIKIVECLVAKNNKLLRIADGDQMTPILSAAKNDRWDIVRYLYPLTRLEDLKPENGPCGSQLVCYCLQAKQFDIVSELLDRCPGLGYAKGFESYPIYEFALLPSAFPSGTSLKFWQRWIYKYIHVEHAHSVSDARINVQNQENEQGDQRNSTFFGLLQGLPSRLSESLGINRIRDLKLHHVRSLEILKGTCEEIKHLNNEEMKRYKLYETVFNAVQNGIVEIVISLCNAKPELLVRKRPRKGPDEKFTFPRSISRTSINQEPTFEESIFHYAVECRQEKVYSLIYGAGERNYLATMNNSRVEKMLYHAGKLSPLAKEKLDCIPGAALQMQRERQWYKEVQSMVTAPGAPPFTEYGLNAVRFFTEDHKELHEKGEKWMKDTASSYIIVSALIITIMFAAAFTVPGGNNQETGFPIFLNEKLFMVFVVSDAISLFSSVTSALMFLSILTSRYAEDDFLKSLPTKMIIGLSTLFISVATMMVAFSSAIFIMLRDKSSISTPIIFLASVPVILFVWMHFPLLLEIFVSTYGGGIFDRKVKRWI